MSKAEKKVFSSVKLLPAGNESYLKILGNDKKTILCRQTSELTEWVEVSLADKSPSSTAMTAQICLYQLFPMQTAAKHRRRRARQIRLYNNATQKLWRCLVAKSIRPRTVWSYKLQFAMNECHPLSQHSSNDNERTQLNKRNPGKKRRQIICNATNPRCQSGNTARTKCLSNILH